MSINARNWPDAPTDIVSEDFRKFWLFHGHWVLQHFQKCLQENIYRCVWAVLSINRHHSSSYLKHKKDRDKKYLKLEKLWQDKVCYIFFLCIDLSRHKGSVADFTTLNCPASPRADSDWFRARVHTQVFFWSLECDFRVFRVLINLETTIQDGCILGWWSPHFI